MLFFVKQKTAYEMRISDWSSDVCSSDLRARRAAPRALTSPAIWIAPPATSNFSVSVVLPASGCEMMAKVRRSGCVDMGQDLLIACSRRRNGKDIGFGRAQRVASLPEKPRGPKIEAISASLRALANFVPRRVDAPWHIHICLHLAPCPSTQFNTKPTHT